MHIPDVCRRALVGFYENVGAVALSNLPSFRDELRGYSTLSIWISAVATVALPACRVSHPDTPAETFEYRPRVSEHLSLKSPPSVCAPSHEADTPHSTLSIPRSRGRLGALGGFEFGFWTESDRVDRGISVGRKMW